MQLHIRQKILKIWENYGTQLYEWVNGPENLKVEPKQEVDTDQMHHYTLHNEVVKSMKEVEDIHQDILKLLEENTLQLMTQPINNIHENGEWLP